MMAKLWNEDNLTVVIGGFNWEVQLVFKVNNDRGLMVTNQERDQCRTASGSERMLRSTMNRALGQIQH